MKLNQLFNNLKGNKENFIEYYSHGQKCQKVYADVYKDLRNVICNLQNICLKKGDMVCIIGKNSYEWVIVDLACVYLGIITVPADLDQYLTDQNFRQTYQIKCVITDSKKLIGQEDSVYSFQSLIEKDTESKQLPSCTEFQPDDIFTLVFTSGTSGLKKAIEIRVKSYDYFIEESLKMFPMDRDDKIIIFLPLSVYLERCYVYGAILGGFNMLVVPFNYVMQAISKDKPTVLVAVPYFFEVFANGFMDKMKSNPFLFLLTKGYLFLKRIGLGKIIPKEFFIFKKAWGGKMKYLLTGSAQCNPNILEFYDNMGITLYEGYGMSEVGGMVALNYPGNYKLGSVGKIYPKKEVFFDEQNQILIKCDLAANNHYYNQEGPNETYLDNNVVATGDIGYLDADGYLFINGRIKETLILSNGRKVHPAYVEKKFLESDLIKNCFVYGSGKPNAVALFVPASQAVTISKISNLVTAVNASLQKHEQIVNFMIVNEPFTIDNGMLTSALKINRKAICDKYQDELDNLYDSKERS